MHLHHENACILNDSPNLNKNPDIEFLDFDTLVIAGGSSKGILTLGALQYAHDNNILKKINTFIGTSSGAII